MKAEARNKRAGRARKRERTFALALGVGLQFAYALSADTNGEVVRACASASSGVMSEGVIRPGEKWYDTDGSPICAQGGSVLVHDGVYWWCAVNRNRTTGKDSVWHNGIVLYSSGDLARWKREGVIIPADERDESSILHPSRLLDRCTLVYNDRTGRFVLWVHLLEDGGQCAATFTAECLTGPWTLARRGIRPNGMDCGDFSIAKDPDGRAYLYFNRPHSMLAIVELSDDYTDTKGVCATFAYTPGPPLTREAPSPFVRNGRHYIITSGTTHYYPNPSETIVSDGRTGPWTNLGELAPDDPSHTTFHSQVCQVLKVPGKKDLYVAIADRWLPGMLDVNWPELEAAYNKEFGRPFDPKLVDLFREKTSGELYPMHAPICEARQVWLPLVFGKDGRPRLEWRDRWSLADYE